jgi:hypothetical protein
MRKYLFILTGAIALSGCASMAGNPVSEPQGGDRARLRAVYGTTWVDQNVCGDRPDLAEGVFVYLGTPYENRSIGMPRGALGDMPERAWGEMYVRADQQIKVRVNVAGGIQNCSGEFYFKPEKGRDYEFIIGDFKNLVGGFGFASCKMNAYDITDNKVVPLNVSREKLSCH